ncbi:glycosyltransferase [Streptomyces sp. NPDC059679]|uniref:glycosyltransferase n=1 Tax=Streptomyces sp. NPDC059679 TaxID=3346903 RepID=UPI0036A99885
MPDPSPLARRNIMFVRVSWHLGAATGVDRAVTTLAFALAHAGHRVVIATAAEQPDGVGPPGVLVEQLDLPITLPCTPQILRNALVTSNQKILNSLYDLVVRHQSDTVVCVGALSGLGRLPTDLPDGVQRALMVPTLQQEPELDMPSALAHADTIITSCDAVLQQATAAAWPTRRWCVVPIPPLHGPARGPSAAPVARRAEGPVRVLAPAGPDVGVLGVIAAAKAWHRTVEIALDHPGLGDVRGTGVLRQQCQALADQAPNITLQPTPGWAEVSNWLAGAAAVIIPCLRPTSSLTALEALSRGTPVIAYNTAVLAELLQPLQHGPRRLLADVMHGPNALLFLTDRLLADPASYRTTCHAAHHHTQDFQPARIADLFCSAVPMNNTSRTNRPAPPRMD